MGVCVCVNVLPSINWYALTVLVLVLGSVVFFILTLAVALCIAAFVTARKVLVCREKERDVWSSIGLRDHLDGRKSERCLVYMRS